MSETENPLEKVLDRMAEGIDLVGQSGHSIAEGYLKTAAAWLRRGRRIMREAQDLLELAILEMEGGNGDEGKDSTQ